MEVCVYLKAIWCVLGVSGGVKEDSLCSEGVSVVICQTRIIQDVARNQTYQKGLSADDNDIIKGIIIQIF